MKSNNATMKENDKKRYSVLFGGAVGKWISLAVFILVAMILFWKFGHYLDLDSLARQETVLNEIKEGNIWLVILVAGAIYILVTGLSLPGALVLSLLYGWYFKFWAGLVIVSLSSTAGATLAFLMSRYFLKSAVEKKFSRRVESLQDRFDKEGPYYLFSMRLIPVFPFWLVNLAMGLTRIRASTFWWVSQLGMLPGTAVVVFTGAGFPSLKTLAVRGTSGLLSPQMICGFLLLATFPWIVGKLKSAWERRKNKPATNHTVN